MNKATKAVVARRVEEVLRIRLDGAEFWDVLQYVAEKQQAGEAPWTVPEHDKPIAERTVWWYIQRADLLLKETFRKEAGRKRLFRRHLAQRRNLYAKAVAQGDIRAALSVIADEAKLLGLYAPIKTALTNPEGDKEYAHGMSDADRAAAIHRIYAAVGAGSGAANTDGQADPDGSAMGGPSPNLDRREHDAGRMAGPDLASGLDTGIAAMFPPSRQEPGGGSAGLG